MRRVVEALDGETLIADNPLLSHEFPSVQKELDTMLVYLRRVHAYDYFTASSHENERMLVFRTTHACLRIQTESDAEG